jgi:acetyl-CoA acetyltransferase
MACPTPTGALSALVSGTIQVGLPDVNEEDISSRAAAQVYNLAGIGAEDAEDIDFVEMHDCFSIAEIVWLEGLGLLPRGEGARLTEAGHTRLGGALPVP